MKKTFFKSFHVAGFTYYEGPLVFNKMKIGSKLKIVTDPNNIHDEFAVEVRFKGKKIGYVPRGTNREMSKIIQAGHKIFTAVIQQISPEEHPEAQVRAAVYVTGKKPGKNCGQLTQNP